MNVYNSIYRRIFFIISLLIFIFSCNKNTLNYNHKLKLPIYNCRIFSSSESKANNLITDDLWFSSVLAKDDMFIFAFDSLVYIDKIIISQSQNFDKIKLITVYSNNGKIGDFIPDEIRIDDTVGFLIFRVSQTFGFHFTKFYKDSLKYKVAFPEFNEPVTIDNVKMFIDDSTQIKLKIIQDSDLSKVKITNMLPKIVDYSFFPKSFYIKSTGEVFGFSKSENTDTIYHGFVNNNGKLNISKLVFKNNSFKSSRYISSFSILKDFVNVSNLPRFRYNFADDFFVDLKSLDTTIVEDVRYATTNNFTGKVIYDCPKCLMRYGAAKDFVKAEQEFLSMGYRIKVFDSYRPHSAQYKLWEIMPNKNYVANPDKGSIHNRGAAVDMTLVDSLGNQLDMGTAFDFFGIHAFSTFLNLPDTVLNNRNLMWTVMHKHGFKVIKTEWWHLSHYSCLKYPISDMPLPCENF